ncbi:MAG: pyridoxal-phosphate dependent enzyme, partial [Defluviitaleaceae bacterium]|nr:pyridoxal-phosphate dependent enzyme [Defluviitaleaceae bacterium]
MKNIFDAIGSTPLVRFEKICAHAKIFAKLESFNPAGSIKCRVGAAMLDAAIREKKIFDGGTIIEPTSGNTGLGLAFACAARGFKFVAVMPETMSLERRKLLRILGAEVILTPGGENAMTNAIAKANELAAHTENSFVPLQFENPANPQIHRETTAEEIWRDMNGELDFFVAGVGTGGTITGVGEILKQRDPKIKIVAV